MSFTNIRSGAGYTQAAGAFTPEDLGGLVDVAVKADSVLARSFTTTGTDKDQVRYPKLVSFPDVAHYRELDTVALADPTTGEVVVPIHRTVALTSTAASWPTTRPLTPPTRWRRFWSTRSSAVWTPPVSATPRRTGRQAC